MPALAIPGLPVGLMNQLPSGVVQMLPAPLSTTWQRKRSDNFNAALIRSACTSALRTSNSRAASPG